MSPPAVSRHDPHNYTFLPRPVYESNRINVRRWDFAGSRISRGNRREKGGKAGPLFRENPYVVSDESLTKSAAFC